MQPNKAIPTERTHPLRMPKGWEPPVPAWSSTFAEAQAGVSMAVVGFQHPQATSMAEPLQELHAALEGADVRDLVVSDAGDGLSETVCIAYWRSPRAAGATLAAAAFDAFWEKHSAEGLGYGVLKECTNIPFERTETLFSSPVHDHGYSQLRESTVGPIPHHQYWGGMRDRIPLSAHDALEAPGPVRVVAQSDRHVTVEAHENLCIIRSGQDWSQCDAEQLAEYKDTIEPTLQAGMAFLRDKGSEVNCYACRYMKDMALDGSDPKRSCGLAYFRTMKDLEDWAEHHPTHLEIFNTFLSIAPRHGPNLQLRLWHEVSVLPAADQRADYVNCRPGTGLMGGVSRTT
ncbi:MAG: phenylacetaldoxime dehydratase family protein [Pseudomonadota bacterium]